MALAEVWEGSGGTPGCSGGVRRPSWRSKRGPEAFHEVWAGSGGPIEIGTFSCMFGRAWDILPEVREGS